MRKTVKGSIPALAGERFVPTPVVPDKKVYPRACGGTPTNRSRRLWASGSIPALAGERKKNAVCCSEVGVYPRACGGTVDIVAHRRLSVGLSPRLRGNAHLDAFLPEFHGSIPALAGERLAVAFFALVSWVYPRACGGTDHLTYMQIDNLGLSPRLRGNVDSAGDRGADLGSIPALAGERRYRPL